MPARLPQSIDAPETTPPLHGGEECAFCFLLCLIGSVLMIGLFACKRGARRLDGGSDDGI